MSNINPSDLFKRQITLSEIGEVGQQKLQNAKVLVVGCGGLGSPIAVYLASSGIGKIHLIDFDKVDVTNLHRQVYYSLEDVGKYKSEALAKFIQLRAPYTEVSFSTEALTKTKVLDIISEYDIIVDGTDSLPTKYLLNDASILQGKPLVYGSLYKFDGYVSSFNLGENSANLRDAFPVMNTDVPNCEEAGILNAIVGMIAMAQVNEVLKIVTGVGKPLRNELLIYNVLQNSQLKMKLQSKISKEEIATIFKKETYYDTSCNVQNLNWLISSEELKQKLSLPAESRNLELIAVLPNLQLPFEVDQTIPLSEIKTLEVDSNKTYVMICQRGITSYKAAEQLKEKYSETTILSLDGGILSY
ncbi:ThiF family adenylyltransferase [Pseudotenacibaculum sp. MALMAid0570]|uniref:ThiF family adenylyltransferase n=1 Tax=Pseudotenacibaculum sp. MALMAid0570 TaxID=3143938 RepID=UPI0032DFF8D8